MTQQTIDAETNKNIETWLEGDFDEGSKAEIRRLQKEDPTELINAFYTQLSFGTGGLRGIMGVGTNRMNVYTVRFATQGLANYILSQQVKDPSVVIGFDCRQNSHTFAKEAASVLAASGIKVYLFPELRPVPLVSFGVRHLGATAGIMITASHNPPKYNGYKVYWSDGTQVLPPHDRGIIEQVNSVKKAHTVPFDHPLIHLLDHTIDKAYIDAIHGSALRPGENRGHGQELSIVYTSLHGGGITMIPQVLDNWGFSNMTLVQEQETPDGTFPTVTSPNPEEKEALTLGIETLKRVKGDILMGTDPDTDRIGVVAWHNQQPYLFNGNEIAVIAIEYICRSLKESHTMPQKPAFVKTIVTSELCKVIAEHHGAQCLDVLTGFKYIGQKITQWEKEKLPHTFLFGGEESYGYLLGTHARDKDAVISAALIAEIALYCKMGKKTLVDFLYEIYKQYGVYRERLTSMTFEGKQGHMTMQKMMQKLRNEHPTTIGGIVVDRVEDYLNHTIHHMQSGHTASLFLPKSDVLRFFLKDGTKLIVRPSGTEPKIKLYCGTVESHYHSDLHALEKSIVKCDHHTAEMLESLKRLFLVEN